MADKYIKLEDGKLGLREGSTTSSGVANAGDIPALDASGKLDPTLLPVGVGPDVTNLPSFENLTAGDYVNIFDDGGTVKARKADNTNGRDAHGYVKDTVISPAAVNVFFEGANANLSTLIEGGRVYLGVTGGVIQTALNPDTETGKIHQFLGIALSETEVNTDIDDCILL